MRNRGATHPFLYDPKHRNCKALGIQGYPVAMLLNNEGRVIWEGYFFPRHHDRICELIERQLEKSKQRVQVF